jgi:hypothetical protein
MLLDGRLSPGQRVTVATDDGAGLAFRISDGEPAATVSARQGSDADATAEQRG